MNRLSNKVVFGMVGAALLTSAAAFAAVDFKKHPILHKAYDTLETAKKTIIGKGDDGKEAEFGGHRAKAVALIDEARKELEEAVAQADSAGHPVDPKSAAK